MSLKIPDDNINILSHVTLLHVSFLLLFFCHPYCKYWFLLSSVLKTICKKSGPLDRKPRYRKMNNCFLMHNMLLFYQLFYILISDNGIKEKKEWFHVFIANATIIIKYIIYAKLFFKFYSKECVLFNKNFNAYNNGLIKLKRHWLIYL